MGYGRQLRRVALSAAIAGAVVGLWISRSDFAQTRPARGRQPAATVPADDTPAGEATVAPKRPQAADTGGMMDRAADSGGQIYVDDSFASVEDLRKAQRYASQGQSQLAIQTFQGIINKYGQKLVYLNNDSYVSITDYVRGKLLGLPSVRSGMYDQLYGEEAGKAIDVAVSDGDLPTLVRVCDRYFPSNAAFAGLMKAGDWCFERGEFAAASRIWQQLLDHPAAGNHQAELLFRAAVAEHLGRNDAAAKPLSERLTKNFADATGAVGGETDVNYATKLADLLKTPPFEAPQAVPDEWPAFEGGPSRSLTPAVDATAGARLWGVSLDDPTIQGDRNQPGLRAPVGLRVINGPAVQQASLGPALSSFPTLANGTIFIHTGERVVGLSASAGTLLWAYPQQVIARLSSQQQQILQSNNAAARPAAHDSVTVYGDDVYAVLPANPVPGQPMMMEYPYSMTGPTRVVDLSRQSGKERWSTVAQTITPETDAPAAPVAAQPGRVLRLGDQQQRTQLTFVGSPMVTRQGVFVMATKSGDPSFVPYYLVRLDRETGAVSWTCYLCSVSTGAMYYGYSALTAIPIPTLVDDVVYISTGQGADCAVDANIGRILWLQVTDSAKGQRNPNEYYVQQQGSAAWKFNPPMVYGNELISYESTGSAAVSGPGSGWLRVYDRWTGQLLTKATRAQLHVGAADIVAGISGNKLILTGQNVSAIDLDNVEKDPQAVWTVTYPSVAEAGKPSGRPFLTQNILYVPFEKGLFTVDVNAGKKMDFWPWPKNDKDVPGKGGNLLVTSEQVVVINDQEIAGYSRWETARDNRLKAIAGNPNAPEPYLALAEISFRTSHLDLAEQNMRKAVDLANAAAGASGGGGNSSAMEMLDRLYRTNLNFAEQLLGKSESELQSRSRFYFEQCKATARGPEQQAEWRLDLSDLSLKENKASEAAMLFNDVLTDSGLREASFHQGDAMARAGVTAEARFRSLIDKNGDAIYKPFEQQAAAELAQAGSDALALQRVVDQYPNSAAAATAAQRSASAMAAKGDFEGQRKALSWLYPRVSGDEKAHITAELTMANLALKRFATADGWAERGLRQFKKYTWTAGGGGGADGGKMTFEALLAQVRSARPAEAEGRLPLLPPPTNDADGRPVGPPDMDEASTSTPVKDASGKPIDTDGTFARGTLLTPIESSPMYSRPNMLFVASGQTIRAFDTSNGTPMEKGDPVRLAGTGPTAALVGCYGDVAVFAQNRAVTGIDLGTMKEAWQIKFNFSVRDSMARNSQPNIPPGAQQVVINGRIVIVNGGVVQEDGVMAPSVDLTGDAETARRAALQQLSAPAFSTLKMIGDKLVVVSGGKVHAYSLKTGKTLWNDQSGGEVAPPVPENCNPVALSGNDDLVTLQLERNDKPGASFLVIDGDSGKLRRQLTLPAEERVYWRGLSGDGMLFVVSDQAVSAYDLMSDSDKPAWRRSDVQSRYPAATQVTLDGLIFVNSYNEVMCLSPEGGEARWPQPGTEVRLNIPAGQTSNGQYPFLRSLVDGDMIIYESTQGVSAYFTYPRSADDGQLAWEADFPSQTTPPLESMQMSDPYVVVMAEGPMKTAQHAVHLVLINRKGGKRHLDKQLHRSASASDIEGPQVQAWMLADNGIALAVNGHVYFYHGHTPVHAPTAEQTQTQAPGVDKPQG